MKNVFTIYTCSGIKLVNNEHGWCLATFDLYIITGYRVHIGSLAENKNNKLVADTLCCITYIKGNSQTYLCSIIQQLENSYSDLHHNINI